MLNVTKQLCDIFHKKLLQQWFRFIYVQYVM